MLEAGEPGGPPGTRQVALLVTQLLEGRRLRVEVARDQIATTSSFSSAAVMYVR